MQSTTLKETNVDEDVTLDDENDSEELGKEEQKSQFIHLRAKGYSYAKIATELKVSTSTLTNWNQELHEAIAQAKAMELEALQEEYFLLKEGRIKLLVKIILDMAAEAIELDVPVSEGIFADLYVRFNAFVNVYNFRLERVCEKKYSWESKETKLEKVLKMLSAIDLEKLKPSPDSLKKFKDEILKDARGEDWLRTKVLSLEYDDGFSFTSLL